MVEIEVNGLGEVLRARVDPTLFASGDREMLEELLPAAINQAQAKAKQLHREAMQSMTEGLNLPGLNEAGNSAARLVAAGGFVRTLECSYDATNGIGCEFD